MSKAIVDLLRGIAEAPPLSAQAKAENAKRANYRRLLREMPDYDWLPSDELIANPTGRNTDEPQ